MAGGAATGHPEAAQPLLVDFLVMEYLEGETLADRLAREGPLTTDDAVRHASEIASALVKAHQWKIVHRDLKPTNVMLTESGAKVLDFGIATRVADAALETATGHDLARRRAWDCRAALRSCLRSESIRVSTCYATTRALTRCSSG